MVPSWVGLSLGVASLWSVARSTRRWDKAGAAGLKVQSDFLTAESLCSQLRPSSRIGSLEGGAHCQDPTVILHETIGNKDMDKDSLCQ